MDPVTQGVLGAVAAQAVLGPRAGHRVWIGGLAGGLLPDADLVLEPLADPALPWELHRHFTHAYVMAPVMGLLAGGLLLLLGYRRRRGTVLLAAVLGALTHAPLDLCTSFGTKVYWPFSLENAALDLFPIIDPVFTVVLIACVLLAAFRHARAPALVAVAFLALYVGTALSQRGAALDAQATLAASRGHAPARARVMAAPASLLAWRSIYEFEGRIYSDLIRPVPFGGTRVVEGTSVALLGEAEILDGVGDLERVRSVVRRFSTFADGWTARVAGDADTVGDMRFSLTPGFDPPWALRLGRGASSPAVRWEQRPFSSEAAAALLRVILGTAPALRPLQAPR
jgi:inner membrane protein